MFNLLYIIIIQEW